MNREINKNIILEFDFSIESLAGRFLDFLFGPKGTSSELSKDKVSQLKKSDEKLQKEAEQMRREGKSEEEIEAFLEAARAQMLIATTGWDAENFEKIEKELSQYEKDKWTGDSKVKAGKEVDIFDLSDKIKSKLEPSFLRGIKIAFDKADKTAKNLGQTLSSIKKVEASQQALSFTLDSIVKQTLGILKREGVLEESKRSTKKYIEKIENYIFEEVKKDELLFEELKKYYES